MKAIDADANALQRGLCRHCHARPRRPHRSKCEVCAARAARPLLPKEEPLSKRVMVGVYPRGWDDWPVLKKRTDEFSKEKLSATAVATRALCGDRLGVTVTVVVDDVQS